MKKSDVIAFFDRYAAQWDDDMVRHEDLITTILTGGGIREGIHVLDVACGTGVLFPDYLSRGVASVTGIDISPEMVKIARRKFPEIQVICGDVEETDFGRQFDAVVVYNAFPHFPDPGKLIEILAGLTKPGGKLTVAHGMSRAALADHHRRAGKVSVELMEAQALAKVFAPWFDVDVVISTDRMYQVSGVRRDGAAHSHGGVIHSHSGPADHDHSPEDEPLEELLALMKFMVRHNDAHARELAQLADRLESAGKDGACRSILEISSDFARVNARLDGVLSKLAETGA